MSQALLDLSLDPNDSDLVAEERKNINTPRVPKNSENLGEESSRTTNNLSEHLDHGVHETFLNANSADAFLSDNKPSELLMIEKVYMAQKSTPPPSDLGAIMNKSRNLMPDLFQTNDASADQVNIDTMPTTEMQTMEATAKIQPQTKKNPCVIS